MSEAFTLCLELARGLLALASALAVLRLCRGPRMLDRLVALDLLSVLVIGLLLLEGVGDQRRYLWIPAIVLALISFLTTVAFARMLEEHALEDDEPEPRRAPADDVREVRG